MNAVFKREWNSMFHTMTAPVFIAILMCVIGIYFKAYNLDHGYPYFAYTLVSLTFILIVAVPLLTMRSFSEERKQKTDQILLTSPLRLQDIVLGKFFAMCAVFALTMALSCLCPLIIRSYGTAFFAVDYSTILAFFVTGCFFISVGMWISSLTESQVIAAVCSFGALLVLYLWDSIVGMLPTSAFGVSMVLLGLLLVLCGVFWAVTRNWMAAGLVAAAGMLAIGILSLVKSSLFENLFANTLAKLSVMGVLQNFAYYNLFDVTGLLDLLLATGVMLFLTAQSIEKRRWS